MKRWLDELKRTMGTDNDGELGRSDMVGMTFRGILQLARRDTRGNLVFPPGVIVRVAAREGSLETLRGWAADPATEAEVTARLLNERIDANDLPARRWVVSHGEADTVEVVEDPAPVLLVLVVEGGDRDGDRYPVGPGRREWRLGRGRWHTDNRSQNDVVLSDSEAWVSRAAAVLRHTGSGFEVEARDQGEFVVVLPKDGTPKRPAMTAAGRVAVSVGDRIEFHDGKDGRIALRLEPA